MADKTAFDLATELTGYMYGPGDVRRVAALFESEVVKSLMDRLSAIPADAVEQLSTKDAIIKGLVGGHTVALAVLCGRCPCKGPGCSHPECDSFKAAAILRATIAAAK